MQQIVRKPTDYWETSSNPCTTLVPMLRANVTPKECPVPSSTSIQPLQNCNNLHGREQ